MKHVLLLLMAVIIACQTETTVVGTASFNSAFKLRAGESITLQPGNVKIGFERVAEDSRCPAGEICFWEGQVRLRFWLLRPDADSVFIAPALHGRVLQSDTCCHYHIDTLGYRITLMQVDPYPLLPVPPSQPEYIAYLKVTRL